MSYLEIDGNRHAIPAGEAVIGSDAASFIVLAETGVAPKHVVVQCAQDGQASVRRVLEDAVVLINGVPLGPQPHPLLHGDKIGVAGSELLFVDERRSGSTQFVSAEDIARLQAVGGAKPAAKRKATAGTGGRLVSLTDGREYQIEGSSLVIGREASCDVVVANKRVSRRHAEIMVTPKGYVVVDMSTNGVWVNNDRISGERLLARADVVRVGDDEFRFYADTAPEAAAAPPAAAEPPAATPPAPPAAAPPTPPAAVPPAPPEPPAAATASPAAPQPPAAAPPGPAAPAPPAAPVGPPPGAEYRLGDTLHGLPGNPPPGFPGGGGSPPAASPPGSGAGTPPATAPSVPPTPPATPPSPPAKPSPPSPAAPASGGPGQLANLIIRSGQLKGHRFPIRVPVVNVGRAEYNDIVIPDSSVSSAHAKVQLREGIWILVDLDSTNGSFVDGEQVEGEAPMAPGAMVRFGDVSVVFEPTKDDSAEEGGGTQLLGVIKIPPQGGESS